jgi:hypothetical protein
MKIIITEEQFNQLQENDNDMQRKKSLIISMYDDGMDLMDIQNYTGLPKESVVFLLKDHIKVDINDAKMLSKYFWWYVLVGDIFDKKKVFDDGSKILLHIESISGSISFTYRVNHDYLKDVRGFATIAWNNQREFPIEVTELIHKDDEYESDEKLLVGDEIFNDPEFRKIKTLSDYIDFLNKKYMLYIKDNVDNYIKHL